MKPARWMREDPLEERLLRIDPKARRFDDSRVGALASHLRAGDLLVLNDAATLPASLQGFREDGGAAELRLLEAPDGSGRARAVLFGPGSWLEPTELRAAPASTHLGERIRLAHGVDAVVIACDPRHPRLIRVQLSPSGDALWPALYAAARPIQYSYLRRPMALWDPQTAYAARPWAVEMPSAGRPLRWELLLELKRHGVELAALTHAAGLSSTGDAELDAALPLSERYDLPQPTLDAIERARARRARVVAVGTTVVRALEGCVAERGALRPGLGETSLKIGPGFVPRVVDGLFTGMHEPTASHFALLGAFAEPELLRAAHAHADQAGYLGHEFGDSALILSD